MPAEARLTPSTVPVPIFDSCISLLEIKLPCEKGRVASHVESKRTWLGARGGCNSRRTQDTKVEPVP